MRVSKFRQAFILLLVIPFINCAASAHERLETSSWADAHRALASVQASGELTGEPVSFDRFILKTADPHSPSDARILNSKAEDEREATPPTDSSAISRRVNLNMPTPPLFNSSSRRLTLIDKTYLDAYTILQESNSCSQFFGGPRIATSILNVLHPRLKETSLGDTHVAISMFGSITFGTDFQTGIHYRLFQQALVNLRGPFYQSINSRSQDFFHKIGHYPANTREARVSMLLHELGHLLRGADGRWLLPDDGDNQAQIAANTTTIMGKCSEQIKSLKPSGQTKSG
jgi:hypothetical protein